MPTISALDAANADQFRAWDGTAGTFWSDRAERFDRGMANYHGKLLESAEIVDDSNVLDIGCGGGQVTRDAARIARRGTALGVDLSSPLLMLAEALATTARLTNVSFTQADAQVYDFGAARFDVAVSRHGTMFFADPVAAFTNIRRGIRPGGRFVQLVWQPLDRNEGISTFRNIAAGRELPAPPPDAPSPFSLSNPERAEQLLRSAGFVDVEFTGLNAPMYYGQDVDDAFDFISAHHASAFGALDDGARRAALDKLRDDISEHLTDHGVYYGAAHWLICAHA